MSKSVTNDESNELIKLVEEKAKNLYETRQLLCSEAVLLAVNNGFGGGLSEKKAIGLASAFPIGIGNSGCLCGAVSGGLIALGLLLGEHLSGKQIRNAAALLHDRFKGEYNSTCCRVLTRNVKEKPGEHFKQCAEITKKTSRITAEILLEYRPELIYSSNLSYLKKKDMVIIGLIKKIFRKFR